MRNLKAYINVLAGFVIASCICACDTDDSDRKWGYSKVYMPQAAMNDGGITNFYPVPFKNNVNTNNYTVDGNDNTLKITLSVYRSGLQELDAFSVNVGVDADATTAAAAQVSKGVELPAGTYSLPQQVSVQDGQRESIFFLEVDLNKLIADYPDYAKKKMVLVVGVSDPSKYELNEDLAKTIVVIDGLSFLPTPPIVNGGDFGPDSEQYWHGLVMSGAVAVGTDGGINNGALVFDYGSSPVDGTMLFYSEIELTENMDYIFSADLSTQWVASANSYRFYAVVTSVKPEVGTSFNYDAAAHNFFIMRDAWNDNDASINAVWPNQDGGWQSGINKSNGEFRANFSGKGYVVIGAAAWTSTIGRIVFDNVKIVEK